MNAYRLKLIAIIAMFFCHIAFVLSMHEALPFWLMFFFYAAGGFVFPIMTFFAAEGYRHTSNITKYFFRLSVFALIAQLFYASALYIERLNILFTIILGLFVIFLYDKIKIRVLFWLSFVIAIALSHFMDWQYIGVVTILMFHAIKKENIRRALPPIVLGLFFLFLSLFSIFGLSMFNNTPGMEEQAQAVALAWGTENLLYASTAYIVGCLASSFLLLRYNGERGKKMKFLFYVFYPAHLAFIRLMVLALEHFGVL